VGEFVQLDVQDGVATIRLDRPKMNAINAGLRDELAEAARAADADPAVRAVILYGGERVFAAGADIKEMAEMSYADMTEHCRALQNALNTVAAIGAPVVAAITGYALGGGLELALCADFRVAGESAKVGQPEIQLGVIPGADDTQRLARLVGPAKAKDVIYTGRFVGAEEALAIGMVDEVVAPDDVYTAALAWAEKFAAGPAQALAAAKKAIDGGLDGDLRSGLNLESEVFAALFATEDQTIGMESFVANGPGKAQFVGR
jgi:enoyl-CoA hydratase/carnithine racemase